MTRVHKRFKSDQVQSMNRQFIWILLLIKRICCVTDAVRRLAWPLKSLVHARGSAVVLKMKRSNDLMIDIKS